MAPSWLLHFFSNWSQNAKLAVKTDRGILHDNQGNTFLTEAWFPFGGNRFRKGSKTRSPRRFTSLILIAGIVSLTLVGERTSAQGSKTAISEEAAHALKTMAADDVRNGKERRPRYGIVKHTNTTGLPDMN